MPFPNIPLASSVDVPLTNGVPQLLGTSIAKPIEAVGSAFGGQALETWRILRARAGWGLFDPLGVRVLGAGFVEALNLRENYAISSAPQEDTSFIAYDKVKNPSSATLRFLCDGSEVGFLSDMIPSIPFTDKAKGVRTEFIASLRKIAGDFKLYTVKTPEDEFRRMNVVNWERNVTSRGGIEMMVIDVHLQEVRTAGARSFVQTVTASAAQTVNKGAVQAVTK